MAPNALEELYRSVLAAHRRGPVPQSDGPLCRLLPRYMQKAIADRGAPDQDCLAGLLDSSKALCAHTVSREFQSIFSNFAADVYIGLIPSHVFNAEVRLYPQGALITVTTRLLDELFQFCAAVTLWGKAARVAAHQTADKGGRSLFSRHALAMTMSHLVSGHLDILSADVFERIDSAEVDAAAAQDALSDAGDCYLLFLSCLGFVVAHEYAHLKLGHVSMLESVQNRDGHKDSILEAVVRGQRQEVDADTLATKMLIAITVNQLQVANQLYAAKGCADIAQQLKRKVVETQLAGPRVFLLMVDLIQECLLAAQVSRGDPRFGVEQLMLSHPEWWMRKRLQEDYLSGVAAGHEDFTSYSNRLSGVVGEIRKLVVFNIIGLAGGDTERWLAFDAGRVKGQRIAMESGANSTDAWELAKKLLETF